MQTDIPFLNLEYYVRNVIDLILGKQGDYIPTLLSIYTYLQVFAFLFSLVCVVGIVYTYSKIVARQKKENQKQKMEEMKRVAALLGQAGDSRWGQIIQHVNSENPNDWRQAILEADIILEDLLKKLGVHGISIGEKLKGLTKADFQNLDAAWEAHKVRNVIAHEGSNFQISAREAKRVIGLFEKVFKEFKVIE